MKILQTKPFSWKFIADVIVSLFYGSLTPFSPQAIIQFDVHRSPERNVEFPSEPWRVSSVSLSIPADVLVYNLTLPELRHSWHSLRLTATPSESEPVSVLASVLASVYRK